MKRAFRGISQPSRKLGARSGLKSIWAKLRRRHLPRNIAPLHKSPTFQRKSQVWRTLCDLASNTRRRFDNIRELLRRHTPSSQLYAMHKLYRNLPPPHHLPAGKAIATAMRKRSQTQTTYSQQPIAHFDPVSVTPLPIVGHQRVPTLTRYKPSRFYATISPPHHNRGIRQTSRDTGPAAQLAKSTPHMATQPFAPMYLSTTQATSPNP